MQSLSDTHKEYIEMIQDFISVPLSQRIYDIYVENNKKGKNVLQEFQKELENIPKWNNHIIEIETHNIIEKSECNYLYKLIKLAINLSIKIKFNQHGHSLKKLKIKMPSIEDFIHKCFINSASFCWKHAYLFTTNKLTSVQIQNNMNTIENNIRKMISKSLRHCINGKDLIEELESLSDKSYRKRSNIKMQGKTKEYYEDYENSNIEKISEEIKDLDDTNQVSKEDIDSDDDIEHVSKDDVEFDYDVEQVSKEDDIDDNSKNEEFVDDINEEDNEEFVDDNDGEDVKDDDNREDNNEEDDNGDDDNEEDDNGEDDNGKDVNDNEDVNDDKDDNEEDDNGEDKKRDTESDEESDDIANEYETENTDMSNRFQSDDDISSQENEDVKIVKIDDVSKNQYFKKRTNLFF